LTSPSADSRPAGSPGKKAGARRRFRPDIAIAVGLLLIPIGGAAYFFLPQYSVYSAEGGIVPVRNIGVEGSVNFCFLREGITRNRFERLSIAQAYPDARFEPADASAAKRMDDMLKDGEELRDATLQNALFAAVEQPGEQAGAEADGLPDASGEDEFERRLDGLIEETSSYYGDSLGLMVAIGLAEETLNEDFSRDGRYVIAGTGTMEADRSVGSVGGISDKLRTAADRGVDLFFVPKDKDGFPYEGLSNEEEAERTAKLLDPRLKVVPVASLDEALDYLRRLNNE